MPFSMQPHYHADPYLEAVLAQALRERDASNPSQASEVRPGWHLRILTAFFRWCAISHE
ncbi:MAG: hypothetical protein ACXWP0_12085 [Ktedonobacterales bacterium]